MHRREVSGTHWELLIQQRKLGLERKAPIDSSLREADIVVQSWGIRDSLERVPKGSKGWKLKIKWNKIKSDQEKRY